MSRTYGSQNVTTNYEVQVRKPFDARMLVTTYDSLFDKSNWVKSGTSQVIAYNGMIVAVANTSDTSKNGLYFLFDKNCTTALKSPDVTNESNWIKIGETSEINNIISRVSQIDAELANINKNVEELELALLSKIESGTISHTSDDTVEGVTVDGTALKIVVDAFTKEETLEKINSSVGDISTIVAENSSNIAATIAKLDEHIATYSNKVTQLDAVNAEQDAVISAVKAIAEKNAADIADIITNNAAEISEINSKLNTVETSINALENETSSILSKIEILENNVSSVASAISEHSAIIETIQNSVYTKDQADAKFMTEDQVDDRLNKLIDAANSDDTITNINNLIEFVNNNAGDIAELVTNVSNNSAEIARMASDIKDIKDAEVDVMKLTKKDEDTLILSCGSAN